MATYLVYTKKTLAPILLALFSLYLIYLGVLDVQKMKLFSPEHSMYKQFMATGWTKIGTAVFMLLSGLILFLSYSPYKPNMLGEKTRKTFASIAPLLLFGFSVWLFWSGIKDIRDMNIYDKGHPVYDQLKLAGWSKVGGAVGALFLGSLFVWAYRPDKIIMSM